VVSRCALARARWPRIAGRSRGSERQRRGRRSRRADLGSNGIEPGPAKPQRSGGFAIATSLGLWVRFSDWSERGIGRPAIPTERMEENVPRGPESARSHTMWGVRRSPRGSPPARRRRAAGEVERDRRALALGGRGDRGRVAVVEDRGRRAADSGYWMVIGGIQTTPGVSMVPVSSHFSTSSSLARRAASSPSRFLAN